MACRALGNSASDGIEPPIAAGISGGGALEPEIAIPGHSSRNICTAWQESAWFPSILWRAGVRLFPMRNRAPSDVVGSILSSHRSSDSTFRPRLGDVTADQSGLFPRG